MQTDKTQLQIRFKKEKEDEKRRERANKVQINSFPLFTSLALISCKLDSIYIQK